MNKNYDFANISEMQIDEINALQQKLSGDGKEVVLIAFEKKFEIADLNTAELEKIHALEAELSSEKRQVVLIAFAKE